jgi:uncharacterized membrane protein
MRGLGTLGADGSFARDISDSGQVVGSALRAGDIGGEERPVVWENGIIRELPSLWPYSGEACSINSRGDIAGHSAGHACLWQNNRAQDLGQFGGYRPEATAINDNGQILAWSQVPNEINGFSFLLDHGQVTQLPLLPGATRCKANAINNSGIAVGACIVAHGVHKPCLWQDGAVQELECLEQRGTIALAINSSGWILGVAAYGAVGIPVLWQPIPEPSSLLALGVGLAFFLRRRSSR